MDKIYRIDVYRRNDGRLLFSRFRLMYDNAIWLCEYYTDYRNYAVVTPVINYNYVEY